MPPALPFDDVLEATPGLLARLLGARGAWADVFCERSLHAAADLEQTASPGRVERPRIDQREAAVRGTGLRVLVDTETRFEAVPDDALSLLRAAADALGGGAPEPPRPAPLAHHDPPPTPLARTERAACLERAADAALGLDADVEAVRVELREHARHVLVAGTDGRVEGTAAVTAMHLLALRVEVVLRVKGRPVTAYAVHGASSPERFLAHPPEAVAEEAVRRARRLADARALPAGSYPVVVGPGWGAVWMHEAVGHRLEADVHASAPLAPAGARVAPPGVTFTDDPTRAGGRGTFAYDDEATPARAVRLVDDGRRGDLLADRLRGGRGHARRQDYRHPPLPRSANLVLSPGPSEPEALLAGVRDGLLVVGVRGGFVRPDEDRFGFEVVEGYRIRSGRRDAPVTGLRVEGSVREALLGIDGVASDLRLDGARGLCRKDGQVVPVSVAAPTVRFTDLEVTE